MKVPQIPAALTAFTLAGRGRGRRCARESVQRRLAERWWAGSRSVRETEWPSQSRYGSPCRLSWLPFPLRAAPGWTGSPPPEQEVRFTGMLSVMCYRSNSLTLSTSKPMGRFSPPPCFLRILLSSCCRQISTSSSLPPTSNENWRRQTGRESKMKLLTSHRRFLSLHLWIVQKRVPVIDASSTSAPLVHLCFTSSLLLGRPILTSSSYLTSGLRAVRLQRSIG